jgi:hypothetical protein
VCASERKTDKPLGEAWLQARPLGMRGGGHGDTWKIRDKLKRMGFKYDPVTKH